MDIPRVEPLIVDGDIEALNTSLSAIRNYIVHASDVAGLDKQSMHRLRLAVDEIAANIIMYGYADNGLTGVVKVRADIDEDFLTITLEDTAVAYDPRQRETPDNLDDPLDTREVGGLGVYLALSNMDVFDYERIDNRNINRFSMRRNKAHAPDAQTAYQILLVEDSEPVRHTFQHSLNSHEFAITMAADRHQALGMLRRQKFDIVLLAINLGNASTNDLIKHIKADPHLQTIPIVVITRDSEIDQITGSVAAGADDYVLYPFHTHSLQTRIRISVQRRGLQDERIKGVLDMSERIRRVLSDPVIARPGTTDPVIHIDEFLQRALTEIKGLYNADAGTVYYREDNILRFVVVQTDSLGIALGGTSEKPITFAPLELFDRDTKEPNYNNMATYVALKGETINIPSIYDSEQFDLTATKAFDAANNYSTVSCLAVPLKNHKGEVIGVLQLLNAQDDQGHVIPFERSKQLLTESLCTHVATILSNRLLIQQQLLMSKIENDIRIGRQIQQVFLPTTFPEVPGWEVASYFHPAREVAGDFYDAFTMPGNRLGFLIADVCDKGVGAALFMSLMRSLLRAYAMQHYSVNWSSIMDTGEILARKASNTSTRKIMPSAGMIALENAIKLTNNYVATIHGELSMFATTFFGVLDPTKGSLLYINAGHCPPMIIDNNCMIKQRIEPTGPAVGMFADATFEIGEITLEPGESLFAFTDGVTDARNPAAKLFKEEGILGLVQQPFGSMKELLHRIEGNLENYMGDTPQFDDITMLGIRRDNEFDSQSDHPTAE